MQSEIDKLRCDLQRYRRLFNPYGCVTDRQVRNTLKEMIAETEAQLQALEDGPADGKQDQGIRRPGAEARSQSDQRHFAAGTSARAGTAAQA